MPAPTFTHLILASPGSDSAYQVGAVMQIEKELANQFKNIHTVVATSSASLIALMLALNYQSGEIKFVHDQLYNPATSSGFDHLKILNQQEPALNARALRLAAVDVIRNKVGNPNITFQQFAELQQNGANLRELQLVANSIQRDKHGHLPTYLFSARQTPHLSLADATLAAAATPGLFPPVSLNDLVFSDGGYVLTNPQSILPHAKEDTLSVLNCSGRKLVIPYETDSSKRILLNQGAPALSDSAPNLTDEQIQHMLETGMLAASDFFHPEKVEKISARLAHKFGDSISNGQAAGKFGIFSAKPKHVIPLIQPQNKTSFRNT